MKSGKKYIKIFYALLVAAPLFMATLFGVIALVSGWEWVWPGYDYLHFLIQEKFGYFLYAGLLLAAVGAVGFLTYRAGTRRMEKQYGKRKLVTACLATMVLALALRMILFVLFGNGIQPSSDGANMWQLVKGNLPGTVFGHYTFFPAYLHYATFLKAIAALTGYKYSAVLLVNVLTNTFSAGLIVLTAYLISGKEKIAFASGLLYAVYPSAVFYTFNSTPEHQCIFFLLLMVLFLLLGYRTEGKKKYALFLIAGMMGGVSNAFKAFFPVVVVALVIVLLVSRVGERASVKRFAVIFLPVILLLAGETVTYKGVEYATSKVFRVTIDSSDSLPHFLVVGLNRQGEGQIHLGDLSHYYTNLRENGVPADEARKETIALIKADWNGHTDEIFSFLVKKQIWAWQDDYASIRNLGYGADLPDSAQLTFVRKYFGTVTQYGYILLMFLCLFAGVRTLVFKSRYNMYEMLNDMIIYGYFWLLLISEAQSRYKCLILPFLCIMAARVFETDTAGEQVDMI